MSLLPPPQEASDIFSLSDQALSERYQFVEEIGFGNWGSVWLCHPKDDDGQPIENGEAYGIGKVAVKLVHRSKTPTTAARVRSLWNEMKIVRSFKNDPHPSIIPFHNFIITPSYALITMAYLPTLVPVEVPELRAKPWFLSLISAVAFLHARGVVHNDIKPANILLTAADPPVPVLVDFGFAEKYDARSSKAFLSNLAYGTPEYLSPERARGLPHDTRKSDVWSLGVTLFEILAGRTPFEHAEPDGTTETFSTKADLEKYWARTVKGKWIGKWSMSKGLEKLLRKMILPNADLRFTAPVALNDSYFDPTKPETPRNSKSRSSISMRSEADVSRLADVAPPWDDRSGLGLSPPASLLKTVAAAGRRENKENVRVSAILGKENAHIRRESVHGHQKTKSQGQTGKGAPMPSRLPALVQPFRHKAKNADKAAITSQSSLAPSLRPLTSRRPENGSTNTSTSAAQANLSLVTASSAGSRAYASFASPSSIASKENSGLVSRAGSGRRVPIRKPVPAIFAAAHNGKKAAESVVDGANGRAQEELPRDKEQKDRRRKGHVLIDLTKGKTNGVAGMDDATTPVQDSGERKVPLSPVVEVYSDSPRLFPNDTFPRSTKESTGIGALKQSIKQSLDKGVRLYKSSALGSYSNLLAKQSTGGLSAVAPECSQERDRTSERPSEDARESWENESAVRNAKSSLPVVRHAIRNEQVAADSRLDRMTIWIRNVEKVVEDARANFAAGGMTPLPPLPPRMARSRVASRRGLKVDQIFRDDSAVASPRVSAEESPATRQRRATLLSRSPEPSVRESVDQSRACSSPTADKRDREAKSQVALALSRPISSPTKLLLELERQDIPSRSPTRLSAVIDSNAFFTSKTVEVDEGLAEPSTFSSTTDRLHSPMTPHDSLRIASRRRDDADKETAGAYDRFLMGTTSVTRLGKGYQSNLTTSNIAEAPASAFKRNPKLFHSARRSVLPPPETPRKSVSVDELGALSSTQASVSSRREDGNNTIKLMRRAFKAITGGSVSRRLSRAA